MRDRRWVAVLAVLGAAGCATRPTAGAAGAVGAEAAGDRVTGPIVWTVDQVPSPPAGGIAQQDPLTLRHMATRIMRIAPGARVPEHYHGGYDETLFVHAGQVNAVLNGNAQLVKAGTVVVIPAGTTITGDNPGPGEAIVIVTWANTGRGGPLTTPGRAPQLRP